MPVLTRPLEQMGLPMLARAAIGLFLFLVVAFLLVPVTWVPADLIRSAERLDSVTVTANLDEVKRGEFVGESASVPLKFGQKTHWLRVAIDPPEGGGAVLLRIRPITVDRVTLFLRDATGTWRSQETGELVEPEQRSWPTLLRHTILIRDVTAPMTALVKVESQSPVTVFLSAYPVATSLYVEVRTMAFHAFIFGLKIVSLLLILLTLPRQKNQANLFFFGLECTYLLYLALHLGYAHALFHDLPPAWLDYASSGIVSVVVLCSTLFHRSLLLQFDPWRITRLLSGVPILFAALGTVLVLAGLRLPGLGMTVLAYLTLLPAILAMLLTMRGEAPPGRRMVRIIYVLYLPVLVLNLATTLGLVRIDWFYRNGPELVSLFNSTLILTLILMMNRALNIEWMDRRGRIRQDILAQRSETKVRRAQHFLTQLVARETRGAIARLQTVLSREANPASPDAMDRAMAALNDVIEDCLQADEAETGIWRVSIAAFDAASLLREMVQDTQGGEAFTIHAADKVMLVSDSGLVGVVLRHLVTNAATYAEPGTRISVQLARTLRNGTSGVALGVTNTVPEAVRIDPERIFEKFFRGSQSSTTSGTGLGLFICREIAARLGGTIHAECVGRSVTFHLWLPDQ